MIKHKQTVHGRSLKAVISDIKSAHPIQGYVDETAEEIEAIVRLTMKVCPAEGRLLDIGCGGLDKTAAFQLLGYRTFACDDFQDPWHRRDDNLARLLSYAAEMGIHVHVQDADYSVPWEPNSFDVVTILSVIEHLHTSPRQILNTAGIYLKPGGLLIIVMPNSVNLRKRLSVMMGKTNYPPISDLYESEGLWRGHVREYTLAETVQILQWTGFDVVYARTFHGMLKRRLQFAPLRLAYKLVCIPFPKFKDSIFVAARKPNDWQPTRHEPQGI